MGVSVGRRGEASLNLVPFLDLLSVCIVFLMATAVWAELASVPYEATAGGGGAAPAGAPLEVVLGADEAWVGRGDDRTPVPTIAGEPDWSRVEEALRKDRYGHLDDRRVLIRASDGVAFGGVVHAMDVTARHGYHEPVLAGP